jgi:hypothetical protein
VRCRKSSNEITAEPSNVRLSGSVATSLCGGKKHASKYVSHFHPGLCNNSCSRIEHHLRISFDAGSKPEFVFIANRLAWDEFPQVAGLKSRQMLERAIETGRGWGKEAICPSMVSEHEMLISSLSHMNLLFTLAVRTAPFMKNHAFESCVFLSQCPTLNLQGQAPRSTDRLALI